MRDEGENMNNGMEMMEMEGKEPSFPRVQQLHALGGVKSVVCGCIACGRCMIGLLGIIYVSIIDRCLVTW